MIVPENHCALFGIMLYVSICFERALTTRNVAEDHVADDLMSALTRIVADRSDGALFFGDYYMMDYELMGDDARVAIAAESAKLGLKASLPPVVPFRSSQWPMRIMPGPGPASLADLP